MTPCMSIPKVQSCGNESRYESLPQLYRVVCQVSQLAGIPMTPLIDNPTSVLRVTKTRRDLISGTSTRITVHKDRLCTEAIQRTSRPFESIDDIESGNSFPLSVFGVSDGITNDLDEGEKECSNSKNKSHILKEYLENTTSLFVDQARDTLHTTTTRETTNGWLGDTYSVCKKV